MEYIFIVGLTSLAVWSIIKGLNKKRIVSFSKIKYTQSYIYEVVKDIVPEKVNSKPKVLSQSQKHIQKNMLKVVITEGKAYWIMNNVFYTANAIQGRIDESTTKPLDIENMPQEEVKKMLSILDDLKQGVEINDSGSTGNF